MYADIFGTIPIAEALLAKGALLGVVLSFRLMKQVYGIDMEQTQYSKTIDAIPSPDVAISMGCDVGCPYIGRSFDDNWGLPDPTGHDDAAFLDVIEHIRNNILAL